MIGGLSRLSFGVLGFGIVCGLGVDGLFAVCGLFGFLLVVLVVYCGLLGCDLVCGGADFVC